MQIFLDTVAQRHPNDPIVMGMVMVMDGAGWYSGKALAAPPNMRPTVAVAAVRT